MRKLLLLLLLGLAHCPHRVWAVGNDNPTGVTGAHSGQITTGGMYDLYTGNGKRIVTDLEVAGSVGAYPLKWTRFLNTRGPNGAFRHGWSHSYQWSGWVRFGPRYSDNGGEDFYEGPDARVYYPDGRVMDFSEYPGPIYQSWLGDGPGDRLIPVANGNYELRMRDGGVVVFIVAATNTAGRVTTLDLRAIKIVDPYKQETTLEHDASGQLSRITEPGGALFASEPRARQCSGIFGRGSPD